MSRRTFASFVIIAAVATVATLGASRLLRARPAAVYTDRVTVQLMADPGPDVPEPEFDFAASGCDAAYSLTSMDCTVVDNNIGVAASADVWNNDHTSLHAWRLTIAGANSVVYDHLYAAQAFTAIQGKLTPTFQENFAAPAPGYYNVDVRLYRFMPGCDPNNLAVSDVDLPAVAGQPWKSNHSLRDQKVVRVF